jgi:hypothetical protein
MKHLSPILLLLLAPFGSSTAEKPTIRGLDPGQPAQTPVHDKREATIRNTAATFLACYMKKQADLHLCRIHLDGAEIWVELNGLRLSRITTNPVTPADRANGIDESSSVQIEYASYRTYDQKTSRWSPPCTSPNWYLPARIIIEHTTAGLWQANATVFHQLARVTDHGDPASIPHAETAALPPK